MQSKLIRANGVYYHIYQRSADKSRIFLQNYDALCFITIYRVLGLKHNIDTLAFCLMDNHLHVLCRAEEMNLLNDFVRDYTSLFVKEYNTYHRRKGSLFPKHFGRAPKKESKKIRTCISYINNNPVEAHKESSMEKYVWNLFAYGNSKNPFSEPVKLRYCSQRLRRSVQEVRYACSRNEILRYRHLERLFENLSKNEKIQLRDLILSSYSPVNYKKLAGLYGSIDRAKLAINSFMGSEYDIIIPRDA